MGLIDKFKNMFTEEVEEDEIEQPKNVKTVHEDTNDIPKSRIEKRVEKHVDYEKQIPVRSNLSRVTPDDDLIISKRIVEEPQIKYEEKKKPVIEEKKVLRREEKFVFPVYFDDKDFEKIEEKPKKIEQPKKEPVKKEIYGTKIEKKEETRVFKPTPIISPIYGVLDKNYRKDDISSKKVARSEFRDPNKPLTIDEVRRKAYGTLEDDLETSLFAKSSIFMESDSEKEEKEESKNNLLTDLVENDEYNSVDEFLNTPIEDYKAKHKTSNDDFDLDDTLNNLENSMNEKLKKIDNKENNTSLDDLLNDSSLDKDDNMLEDYIMNNNKENEETKDDDDLTQSDLFNLIDSMYEKGEDK